MNKKLIFEEADFNEIRESLAKVLNEVELLKKENSLAFTWLDNDDVSKMLKVSKRTLQNYRDNGLISFSQISNKIFYKVSDINQMLERHYIPKFKQKWN